MRTMRERRDLAKVVKVASIHSHLITWIDNQDARRTFFANSDAMYIDLPGLWIKRAKKHLTDPHDHFSRFLMTLFDHGRGLDSKAKESVEDKYEPHYGHGDCWLMSQLVAMLIKQLPNLQHFSTRGCQHILGSSPESFLADLQLLHLPMKILDIETWISPLVELASGLETLNIHGTWASEPPIPKMPNLKVLRLIPKELKAHWDPSASFLEDILLACTGSLCTFVLEAPSAGNGKYSVPGMELGRIIYLLRHHQNTLKCLHLDIRRVRFPKVRQYQYPSLNDFTSLEHLLLSSNTMAISSDGTSEYEFLNRMIPPSIKTLHFLVSQFGGKHDLEKDLRRLASSKWHTPTVLPNLRQVICDLEHPFMNNDVANDFTAVGVEFGYKRWREFEHGRDRPNDGRYNFRVVGDVPIRLELGRTSYY
ncbi:hypothetical protein EDB81DRAFT_808699 [Dactylonectria macrodidyma]|uniref:Uncharacterized protein n=1 Tax=Dactylonectria macrodidyma TaxID=307937 RepID=A0A9P9E1T6_9HYPO|nr:hypothetical protein EDB81DRAFT_808699 [Dactylonectria macrodidyma]